MSLTSLTVKVRLERAGKALLPKVTLVLVLELTRGGSVHATESVHLYVCGCGCCRIVTHL